MRLTKDQITAICEQYTAGATSYVLGREYKVDASTIRTYLRRRGVDLRPGAQHLRLTEDQITTIVEKYIAGVSSRTLGHEYNVSKETISNYLRRRGVDRRSPPQAMNRLTEDQITAICERYINGESSSALGREYDISETTVRNYLQRCGVARRPSPARSQARRLTEDQITAVCERYTAGTPSAVLSREFGVSAATLCNYLQRRGISRHRRHEHHRLTEDQITAVCGRYIAGESSTSLGREFGVSDGMICHCLQRRGVARRSQTQAQRLRHPQAQTRRQPQAQPVPKPACAAEAATARRRPVSGWIPDDEDFLWVPNGGEARAVVYKEGSMWRAMNWGTSDGRTHTFEATFDSAKAAMRAVEVGAR
jgi:transposase